MKITSVNIDVADNGYIVFLSGKTDNYDYRTERLVFTDLTAVYDFLNERKL